MVSMKEWHDALKNANDTQLLTWIHDGDFKYCPIDIVVRVSTPVRSALLFHEGFLQWYEHQAKNHMHAWMTWAITYIDITHQWEDFCASAVRYTILLRYYDPKSCYIFHKLPNDALTWCAYHRVDLIQDILPEHFERIDAHPLELMGHIAALSTVLYEKTIIYLWEYYFNNYKPKHSFEECDRQWLRTLPLDCYYYAVYCDQDGIDDIMHEILSFHKTPEFVHWLLTSEKLKKRNQLSMFMDYVDLYRQSYKPLVIDFYRRHPDIIPIHDVGIFIAKKSSTGYYTLHTNTLLGESWLSAYLERSHYSVQEFQEWVHRETVILKEVDGYKKILVLDVLQRLQDRQSSSDDCSENELYL